MYRIIFSSRVIRLFSLSILWICLGTSCATYNRQYGPGQDKWTEITKYNPADIHHTLYFLGDAGAAYPGENDHVLLGLEKILSNATDNSSLIFLGDNVYPDGLPHRESPRAEKAYQSLDRQLDIINDFHGKSYIIPGNHDWGEEGLRTLIRQEEYVKNKVGENTFFPENGCPGPEVIEINDLLTLVIVDSQWYLEDWTRSPEIHQKCDIKNREDFIFELRDVFRKNKDKYLVLALHHPLESYGKHAGYYPARSHLLPLTDLHPSLILPLPVLGSVVQLFRRNIGQEQDLTNPLYKNMISEIKSALGDQRNVIFLSGHEHNLQLIERKERIHVIAGSGSKIEEVKQGANALFVSGNPGFGKIEFYDQGQVKLYFYEVDQRGNPQVVYSKELHLEIAEQADFFPDDFPVYYNSGDSILASVYSEDISKGVLYNSLFGEHYRTLYTTPIKVPVFDLFRFGEGLRPVRRGGGSQTNSLRLELPDGKEFTMRALRKDASKLLPDAFRESIAVRFLEDQFTSAHPFAAFAVPRLAEAAEIFHTHPRLYYVPKQPALEYFNEFHGNELYLFEERPDDDMSHAKNFGYSTKVISTPDLLEELYRDKEAEVDQRAVARARLFDILINDWDRHDDQWRWALIQDGEREIYAPIPRDRDQAFSKFDGWITSIINKTLPVFRQMRSFDYTIPDVPAINHNGRFFDRTFMHEIAWMDWKQEVDFLKEKLNAQVIQEAVQVWPKEVYKKYGPETEAKLESRLDKLDKYAWEYYTFLNKTVDIPGTEDRDTFTIEGLDRKRIKVTLSAHGKVKYERIFHPSVTKQIRMYGREKEDVFTFKGKVKTGIDFFLLGGEERDRYIVEPGVEVKDQVIIYENLAQPKQAFFGNIQMNRSDQPRYYTYNRKSFQYDYGFFVPSFGFDPDDGLLLGLNYSRVNHGFMKWPMAAQHTISGRAGLFSQSFRVRYKGEFISALESQDVILKAEVYSPQFITNFFGFGNDTERGAQSIDFYRIRNRLISLEVGLRKRFSHGGSLLYSLKGSMRKVIDDPNKFLSEQSGFDPFYRNQIFLSGFLGYEMSNVDKVHYPTRGLKFDASLIPRIGLRNTSTSSLQIQSKMTLYQELLDGGRLVAAGRIGINHFVGDVDLFQYAPLGGRNEIRGYRNERFAGGTAFYINSDLRFRIGTLNFAGIPFATGGSFGYDMGRVYLEGEQSDTWHRSYSSGLWFSPFNVATFSTIYSVGSDENRITLKLGFFF